MQQVDARQSHKYCASIGKLYALLLFLYFSFELPADFAVQRELKLGS